MQSETLTPGQVAVMFAVHPATVARWAEAGTLQGFRTPGGHWRFHRSVVEEFLDRGLTPPVEPAVSDGAS